MSKKVTHIELGHGGSGRWGNSAWADRATGCLEYARLAEANPLSCELIYKPSATGPNAMLVGSMVHAYIEHELLYGQESLPREDEQPVTFVDTECDGWEPPADAAAEAHRVYWGWVKVRQNWDEGETLGAEVDLSHSFDGITISAKIDHLVKDSDGVICLEDFKTSGRSGDYYTTGRTRLQMHLYTMAAWAMGIDVQRIRIRQIVKTKTVQEHIYQTIDLPTPQREEWILRYLRGAQEREASGQLGPRGAECDSCYFGKNLICKL